MSDVEISAELLNRAMVSAVPARLYVGPDQDQIQGKRGKAKQSNTHSHSFLSMMSVDREWAVKHGL